MRQVSRDDKQNKEPLITRRSYRERKQKQSWTDRIFGSSNSEDKIEEKDNRSLEERVATRKDALEKDDLPPHLSSAKHSGSESKYQKELQQDKRFSNNTVNDPKYEITKQYQRSSSLDDKIEEKSEAVVTSKLKRDNNKQHRFYWRHTQSTDELAASKIEDTIREEVEDTGTSEITEVSNKKETVKPRTERKAIDNFLNYGIAVCVVGLVIVTAIAFFV